MARMTYKTGLGESNGPAALGKLFVSYWENIRNKESDEIEVLTASLKSDIASLFEESTSGEVEIQLVQDTASTVHIPIPVPSSDLSKYQAEGFAEAFGHAIIMGCGRSPKLHLETTQTEDIKREEISSHAVKAA